MSILINLDNPKQPKVFVVKFSSRKIERIFLIEIRNFKLWKMPKLLNFRFRDGRYFLKSMTILN